MAYDAEAPADMGSWPAYQSVDVAIGSG